MLDRVGKASAAVIVVGIALAVAAGVFTTNLVDRNSRSLENAAAERLAQRLQLAMQLAEAKLHAISGYFAVERTVTPGEFEGFISQLENVPILKALQFVRLVPGTDLDRYVATQQALRPGFSVSQRTEDATLTRATERELHYVIEFISPLKGNEEALGLDAGSNPAVSKAYAEAVVNPRTGLTGSFNLVQNKDELALLLYTPAVKNPGNLGSVIGFATGLVSLDKVVSEIMSERAAVLGIRSDTIGADLIPARQLPDGFARIAKTIGLPGGDNWTLEIASLRQDSGRAAGLLVFGLGALLTLLALAALQQSRLQASNLRVGALLSASERSLATSELSLAAREAAYRGLFENASTANIEVDIQSGEILRVNEAMIELSGLNGGDVIGKPAIDVIDDQDQEILSSALTSKQASTDGLPGIELRLRHEDGDSIWVLASIGETSEGVTGAPSACIVMQDISARKMADEARDLLVRELAHRVRNSMQLIGSLADQTSRSSRDVPSFLDSFKGRLLALNSAQDALFDANWGPVRVDLLTSKILEPFETGTAGSSIHTDIEALTLLPQEAQTVALALHELANNASRHGALKTPGGKVHLTIKLDQNSSTAADRILKLTWAESGGAEPVSAPETTGFGSIMLERLLARQHGGESRFYWDPDGMTFEARLPLANAENVETNKKY